jgi:hypothetical protein
MAVTEIGDAECAGYSVRSLQTRRGWQALNLHYKVEQPPALSLPASTAAAP